MINVNFYNTRIGLFKIAEDGIGVTELEIVDEKEKDNLEISETPLLAKAAKQLEEYLSGKRMIFDFPLNPKGTEFQKKVWEVLKTIPYGETWSYKQVAVALGKPTASRAVGMANNRNPIMIVVPCHRVVGSNGDLVGYAGGLDLKAMLLKLEKEHE
ncbi:methylated-DNA-[protein]-cysteine S-methyltransferase [Mobilisporobacter senegalensis]|uniref:Methylated-DNA--protein-cysteine methyltransferase n=1 Tax=Mobilisporobacter senegalensis TaxID=1329262 RepID=A0A3N1XL52_9FIRM|nr:methylated-DNA--[protein]-cysteine S-methyltransferase [Mobilisporobacter senegalensis]ROR27439.1 methylated-DNA-[protein]-cysteine S-methyltransferase [Mobilisporobacter senegalensis]